MLYQARTNRAEMRNNSTTSNQNTPLAQTNYSRTSNQNIAQLVRKQHVLLGHCILFNVQKTFTYLTFQRLNISFKVHCLH